MVAREWKLEVGLVEEVPVGTTLQSPPRPALFVDRDGTLMENLHYLSDPDRVVLFPGVPAALRRAQAAGRSVVMISNQSGLGRGLVSMEALRAVHERVIHLLEADGVELAGTWYCTHGPDDGCICRKPRPGMLQKAAERLGLALSESWMIGDRPTDVEAAVAAGARGQLLDDATPDLPSAVDFILSQ